MSDIFLSYASEDRNKIRPLVDVLQKRGWSVFWDRTIPTGKNWRQVIGKEIREAKSIVVVWTEQSVDSDWVQEEAEEGKRRNILFPVALDEVIPPFGFGSIQAADLVSWDGSPDAPSIKRLMSDLSRVIGNRQEKEDERKHTKEENEIEEAEEEVRQKSSEIEELPRLFADHLLADPDELDSILMEIREKLMSAAVSRGYSVDDIKKAQIEELERIAKKLGLLETSFYVDS